MTTIAYKDGVIAADSRIEYCGAKAGYCQKLHPHDGGVISGSGAFGEICRVRDWIMAGADPEQRPEIKDSDIIWVQPDGSVIEYDSSGRLEYDAPFYAYGSGRQIAIGAMAAGSSAEEAVRIACEWDSGTGGEVMSVKIGGRD